MSRIKIPWDLVIVLAGIAAIFGIIAIVGDNCGITLPHLD